ncbi:MAG: GGDEF domain-containing response regulator [Elusimicrobiota bacterium]
MEDDARLAELLTDILREQGFDVFRAATLAEGRQLLARRPQLLLLDWTLPDGEGVSLIREARADPRLTHLPILMLTGRSRTDEKVAGFSLGADDYLTKPFEEAELCARVWALIRRTRRSLGASPLTGLPGNNEIEEEVLSRLARGLDFDAVYCDIDNFKPFNDRYGFAVGDRAIKLLSECLLEAARADFVGHIGGDDFVALAPAGHGESFANRAVAAFAERARGFHDEEDRARGWYESKDRQDRLQKFPLLSVTAAVVPTTVRRVRRYSELAEAAAGVKSAARKEKVSVRAEKRLE